MRYHFKKVTSELAGMRGKRTSQKKCVLLGAAAREKGTKNERRVVANKDFPKGRIKNGWRSQATRRDRLLQ